MIAPFGCGSTCRLLLLAVILFGVPWAWTFLWVPVIYAVELIAIAGLPVAPPDIGAEEMLRAMGRDKKVQGKSLRFVLLRELGEAYVTDQFDEATLYNICEASA